MKITELEKQVKRDRYNVYLDGVYGFSVSSRILADFGLEESQDLTDKQIEKIKDADKENKAYNRAILILSYRANTEVELKKKLIKNFDEPTAEKVITKLKGQGLLNDADFAERYIEQSKKGKKLVSLELLKKGVDKETINKLILEKDKKVELENALKLAEKIFAKHQKEPRQIIKQKIYERLTRRGFSYDIYKAVIGDLGI